MKNIDFLPEAYRRARRCHGNRMRRIWLAGTCLALLACWFILDEFRLHSARAYQQYLARENQTVQAGLAHIAKLQAEQLVLMDKYRLLQDLRSPVSNVNTILRIAEMLPQDVALKNLQMTCRPATEPRGKAASEASAKSPQGQPAVPRVSLSGVAPSQVDIAILVGQLSGCREFANVRLDYCRAAELESRRVQEFRVTFEIPGKAAASQATSGV